MVSMMADGEMRASSMAAEGETTGTISMGSLAWMGVGACEAVRSRGRIWSMVRFWEARTRSRPSRERARFRLRKLEIWACGNGDAHAERWRWNVAGGGIEDRVGKGTGE